MDASTTTAESNANQLQSLRRIHVDIAVTALRGRAPLVRPGRSTAGFVLVSDNRTDTVCPSSSRRAALRIQSLSVEMTIEWSRGYEVWNTLKMMFLFEYATMRLHVADRIVAYLIERP